MSALRLAANLITPFGYNTEWGHLQIVYKNGNVEEEMEIQAPWNAMMGDWDYPQFGSDHTLSPNYNVTDKYAYTDLDLGDRSVEDVWLLLERIYNEFKFNGEDIEYNYDQNSNSFINTVLKMIGINLTPELLSDVTPADVVDGFPGVWTNVNVEEEASFSFNLTLTTGKDILVTGSGNDYIVTNGGNDILTGGLGEDTFVITPDANTNVTITDFVNSQIDEYENIINPGDTIDLSAFSHITSLNDLIALNNGLYTVVVTDPIKHIGETRWNLGDGQYLAFQTEGEWYDDVQSWGGIIYLRLRNALLFLRIIRHSLTSKTSQRHRP